MAHHHISGKRLSIAIILNLTITLLQVIFGILSSSLSLLSDALHNFSDVMALVISWLANRISHKKAKEKRTFGYIRAEIIAALFNSSVLMGIGVLLIYESVKRLFAPQHVDASTVIILGTVGIIVNTLTAFYLHGDSKENINIRSAYLHIVGDVLTSVAVVIGGIFMVLWKVYYADSVVSMVIALYLIYASFGIIKESVSILMEFAPEHTNLHEIESAVKLFKEIDNLHHVHIWRVGEHDVFFEAHVEFKEDTSLSEVSRILGGIEKMLFEKFAINHSTLQPELKRCEDKSLVIEDIEKCRRKKDEKT